MTCENCANAYDEGYQAGHNAENARLREAILDIDAHAAPLAINDEHGKLGYIVSVGSLHRALGVIGYTSRKCVPEALCSICKRADGLAEALEELQATVQATCEGGQVDIPGLEILGEALDEADAVLRTYREANRE